MPATKGKHLAGLNLVLANERKAIVTMTNIINKIQMMMRQSGQTLFQDKINETKEAIAMIGNYLKNYYKYNLRLDSSCIDHCVRWSCSHPNDIDLKSKCNHKHDEDRCQYCRLIPQVNHEIQELISNLVNAFEGQEDALRDLDELRHDLHVSVGAIKDYQDQLKRNYVQSLAWENLIENDFLNKRSDTAYLTIGKFFSIQKHVCIYISYVC